MNDSIFVLEYGEYSEYRVIGVFSSRENAEIIQRVMGGTIVEWPLNPFVNEINKGYTVFEGEMLRDGTIERMVPSSPSGRQESVYIWRRSTAPDYQGRNMPDCLHGTVWAKNVTHAIKIFNEKRTAFIALNEW